MPVGLFSTYRGGENRVTSSILAVLRSLSLDRFQRLLGGLVGLSNDDLVRVEDQPSRGGSGIPDGEIRASMRIIIETKRHAQEFDKNQLQRHMARFHGDNHTVQRLLCLSRHSSRPPELDDLGDPRVCWASFADLETAIADILSEDEIVSEREGFLLQELRVFLEAEGLLRIPTDVLIVAAGSAWREYLATSGYFCQPNRSFRPSSRLAFYTGNAVRERVPAIIEWHDDVVFEPGLHSGELGKLVDRALASGIRHPGDRNKVLVLSSPDDSRTLQLKAPITNDKVDRHGRRTAFTMGAAKYTYESRVVAAATTSEL